MPFPADLVRRSSRYGERSLFDSPPDPAFDRRGTLLGAVAHELNTPLSAVIGFTGLLPRDARAEDERAGLQTIRREADRTAKIVTDVRLIARDTEEAPAGRRERVDLNDVVRHVLKTRHHSLRTRTVEVDAELAPGLPAVRAERGPIEQVVLTRVVNAEQALADCAARRRLSVRTAATPAGASLSVADTGPGIPPHLVERNFDPFFTTQHPGEGTGLGVSPVHGIVAGHGGEIRVDSRVGEGAAVRVELPRAPADEERPAPAAPEAPARPRRVLVVDDEEAVRRVIVRFLTRRGHTVDEAVEGSHALERIRDAGPRGYDAIVSDLRMPGLGGDELLAHLRARGDGMDRRLLFLTGDTASPEAERVLAATGAPVLSKPVSLEELARALDALDG